MAQPNEHDHGGDGHGFEIIVNAKPFPVHDADVQFDEVVDLVYPGQSADPSYIFKVDFDGAVSQPHSGSLVQGGHVQVKKSGTEFSVIRSLRS